MGSGWMRQHNEGATIPLSFQLGMEHIFIPVLLGLQWSMASTGEFAYDAIVFTADGGSTTTPIDMGQHSLAVGKNYALIVGYASSARKLLLVDSRGRVTKIDFPKGYRLDSPYFPYSYVSYLGNDRFEILQADRVVEGERGHTVDFTSFEVELKKNYASTKRVLSISHFIKSLPEDFVATYALRHGDSGYVTEDGRVYVHERLNNKPTFTGQLEGFSKEKHVTNNNFIPVNSRFGEPSLGFKAKTLFLFDPGLSQTR